MDAVKSKSIVISPNISISKWSVVVACFTLLTLVTWTTYASSFFSPALNNLQTGSVGCGYLKIDNVLEHIHQQGFDSQPFDELSKQMTPQGIFEEFIFRKSQNFHQGKYACVHDVYKRLESSDRLFKQFRTTLVINWLNWKKSELIIKQCQTVHQIYQSWMSAGWINLKKDQSIVDQVAKASRLSIGSTAFCLDSNKLKNLITFRMLIPRSLPMFTSSEMIQLINDHRTFIQSKKTKSPITDSELLDLDVNFAADFVLMDQNRVSMLNSRIRSQILRYLHQQAELNFKNVDSANKSRINDSHMARYWEDGTLDHVLKADQIFSDAGPKMKAFSSARQCILNQLEPNLVGGALDFAAAFAGTHSLLSKVEKIKNMKIGTKVLVTSLAASSPWITKACLSSNLSKTVGQVVDENESLSLQSSIIPEGFDTTRFMIDVEEEKIPSCQNQPFFRLAFMDSQQLSCIQEGLLAALPGILGLGYGIVGIQF